jgi:phospholipase C
MSTCTKWVDDGTNARTNWAVNLTTTCVTWADQISQQCQTWADEGSNQCQNWADQGSNQCQAWADNGYNQCCTWAPCSWFCDAFVWISNWVCQGWYWVAKWVCLAWYWVANWVCQAYTVVVKVVCAVFSVLVRVVCVVWSWIAKLVCIAWDTAVCLVGVVTGGGTPTGPIKHVFVLMLENRAFDHMLGFAAIRGMDGVTGGLTVVDDLTSGVSYTNPNPNHNDQPLAPATPADFMLWNNDSTLTRPDPGHEFDNALLQLCGYTRQKDGTIRVPTYSPGNYPTINNSGFIASYFGLASKDGTTPDVTDPTKINQVDPERILHCFDPAQLPVLTTLAQEFAICDRWFSSLPGPTWPNRFFIHAASSGGLDDSPSNLETVTSTFLNGYRFENGTVFDALEDKCFDWNVFMGDELPQVFAISGMTDRRIEGHFDDFENFSTALSDPAFSVPYIFIEPNYGNVLPTTPGDFTCGNSQHPLDDITRGEKLIKDVYEAIRNSPHWNDSILVVTYDEQGGFYDHVPPPMTVSPGDIISDPNNSHHSFDFTQLGIRVPAVIISPWIPKNVIDHTVYDHSSLLATMESLYGLPSLTKRDASANTFSHLLSLTTPRTDAPATLPDPAHSGVTRCGDPATTATTSQGLSEESNDTSSIEPVLGAFLHVAFLRDYHHANPLARPAILRRYRDIHTRGQAVLYIQDVARRIPTPQKRFRKVKALLKLNLLRRAQAREFKQRGGGDSKTGR